MIKNVFLLAALSLCLFQSCDNDDNEPVPGYVSAETKALLTKNILRQKMWSGRRVTII